MEAHPATGGPNGLVWSIKLRGAKSWKLKSRQEGLGPRTNGLPAFECGHVSIRVRKEGLIVR